MDRIRIRDMEVFAFHGVFPEEKKLGQKFLLDLCLYGDFQQAGVAGDLESSVDYGEAAEKVREVFAKNSRDLIETAAEDTAEFLLKEYPLLQKVTVEVKKPWAPVHIPMDTVSVKIERKRNIAFIGLGSNIGDSERILKDAKKEMEEAGLTLLRRSETYRTKAWGVEDQPDFLNEVVMIETFYSPAMLLDVLQSIEKKAGRKREVHWGPRTLDLDILFYNDEIVYTKDLQIPHPYIAERDFVLEPMAEIAPFYIHPVEKKQMRTMWEDFKNK